MQMGLSSCKSNSNSHLMLSNAEKSNSNSSKEAEGVATILVAREEHWHCTWSGGAGPWYDPPESVLLLATEGCLGTVESEAWQQGLDISQAHNHPAQSGYWHHQFVAAKCCWPVEKHSTPPFVSSSWESVPFSQWSPLILPPLELGTVLCSNVMYDVK